MEFLFVLLNTVSKHYCLYSIDYVLLDEYFNVLIIVRCAARV